MKALNSEQSSPFVLPPQEKRNRITRPRCRQPTDARVGVPVCHALAAEAEGDKSEILRLMTARMADLAGVCSPAELRAADSRAATYDAVWGLSVDSTIAGFVDMERARSNPSLQGTGHLVDRTMQGVVQIQESQK